MYEDHTVGVVIPAYNEAGFVGDVIETIPDYVDRIYPVDDCSTDGTWTEIRETAARIDGIEQEMSTDGGTRSSGAATNGTEPGAVSDGTDSGASSGSDRDAAGETPVVPGTDPDGDRDAGFSRRVVPIRHAENRGVGGAIKTGYQRARADEIDVTVVMGGDGQMDPDWLPDLLDPIVDGRAEYAKANRLLVDEHHETMPGHRFVGNHLLTVLTKIATGYWSVGDPQHGYTAISLEALETAGVDEMYEFFGYCNDLLIRLSAENLRVADVPCPLTYADEESHIDYSSYIPRVSGMLLRSFLRRLWVDRGSSGGRGRLALFLGGAIATVGGLLGVGASAISSSRGGDSAPSETDTSGEVEQVDAEEVNEADGANEVETAADDRAVEQPETEREEGGAEQAQPDTGDPVQSGTDESTHPATEVTEQGSSSSVYRYALLAVAGVAALLGAMLVDAVMNSNHNYTERMPENSGPRVGEEGATDGPAARQE